MNHLADAQLREYLDGELEAEQATHLENCPDCQERLSAIQGQQQRVRQKLAFLSPAGEDQPYASGSLPLAARPALARFKTQLTQEKESSMLKKIFGSRPVWFGAVAILVLALVLGVPQVRAWAGQFLGLFRVQKVAVLPIDTSGLSQLNGNPTLANQISEMLSSSVTVDQKPGEPKAAASAAEASQMAGFSVRLPASQSQAPKFYVSGSAAFQFVVDRARAQALLDESGHKDLVLPGSLDGAKISVNIPSGVSAAYGNCPAPTQGQDFGPNMGGSAGRRYPDCVMLMEIPSPSVSAPPDVDIQQLAQIGLEFTGMSAAQAQAYSQSIDWTSSLVIPIPKNAATYQQVTVDGVTGELIQRPADDAPQYALVWVKDGVIYAIGGLGTNSAQAIDMANSMK